MIILKTGKIVKYKVSYIKRIEYSDKIHINYSI